MGHTPVLAFQVILVTLNHDKTVVHTPQLTFHGLEVNIQTAGFACIRLWIFLTFRLCLLVECEVLKKVTEKTFCDVVSCNRAVASKTGVNRNRTQMFKFVEKRNSSVSNF